MVVSSYTSYVAVKTFRSLDFYFLRCTNILSKIRDKPDTKTELKGDSKQPGHHKQVGEVKRKPEVRKKLEHRSLEAAIHTQDRKISRTSSGTEFTTTDKLNTKAMPAQDPFHLTATLSFRISFTSRC